LNNKILKRIVFVAALLAMICGQSSHINEKTKQELMAMEPDASVENTMHIYSFLRNEGSKKQAEDFYTFVELTKPGQLKYDGILMHHSGGREKYRKKLQVGEIRVFSLRNSKNIPCITIEIDVKSNRIGQISGHGDTKIIHPKYHAAIYEFMKSKAFELDYRFYSLIPVIDMPDGSHVFLKQVDGNVVAKMRENPDGVKFRGLEGYKNDDASLRQLLKDERIEHLNIGSLSGLAIFANLWKFIPERAIDTLDFKDNFIRADGMTLLASVLKGNPRIKNLDLRRNFLRLAGAETLAECLRNNTNLEFINITGNHIGNEGVEAFGSALKDNMSLRHLDISENEIGRLDFNIILIYLLTKAEWALQFVDSNIKHAASVRELFEIAGRRGVPLEINLDKNSLGRKDRDFANDVFYETNGDVRHNAGKKTSLRDVADYVARRQRW